MFLKNIVAETLLFLLKAYFIKDKMKGIVLAGGSPLGRGFAWFDTETVDSLYAAQTFVKSVESMAGISIAVLEEIAYNKGWIDKEMLIESARMYDKSAYGRHLLAVSHDNLLTFQ